MNEVYRLISDIARARQRVLSTLHGFSAEQGAFRPAVGGWSIAEVVEHLVLAEQLGINLLWRVSGGAGEEQFAREAGGRDRIASMEAAIEKARRESDGPPDAITPRSGGPLGYWVAALQSCQVLLEAAGCVLKSLDLSKVMTHHALPAPLEARQHLEFLRVHLDEHGAQIRRMIESPAFRAL